MGSSTTMTSFSGSSSEEKPSSTITSSSVCFSSYLLSFIIVIIIIKRSRVKLIGIESILNWWTIGSALFDRFRSISRFVGWPLLQRFEEGFVPSWSRWWIGRAKILIRPIHSNKGFRWKVWLIFVYLPSREVPFRRFNRSRTTSQQRESLGKCDWGGGSAVFASSLLTDWHSYLTNNCSDWGVADRSTGYFSNAGSRGLHFLPGRETGKGLEAVVASLDMKLLLGLYFL